jgi:hypothetical protein
MTGGFLVYASGLWNSLNRVLSMPLHAITANDLLMAGASFVVVFGRTWLGTWIGPDAGGEGVKPAMREK